MIQLIRKRLSWCITPAGYVVILLVLAGGGWLLANRLHDFLAVDAPVTSEVLVVSGIANDQGLAWIADQIAKSPGTRVLVIGGPLGRGSHLSAYETYAGVGAATLRALGVDPGTIVELPTPPRTRDRTYASAVSVREWLAANLPDVQSVNVATPAVRGRRTRVLFRSALAPRQVGIIAIPALEYDPEAWWTTSQGVRTVLSELIAYLYTVTLFRPDR